MTTFHPDGVDPADDLAELRQLAVTELRKKRGLSAHILAYVLVNLMINGVWLAVGPHGFYWPVFPLLGWGIGIAFHVWDVYAPASPSEDRIKREMDRLSH